MGNGVGKLSVCFSGDIARRRPDLIYEMDPPDEGLGHSFCYIRPEESRTSLSKTQYEETTTFRTISGGSVSANTSTPLSTSMPDFYSSGSVDRAAAFESSTSFSSIPLHPIPRNLMGSGPFSATLDQVPGSGPMERGFFSGPMERGFMSGPIEKTDSDQFRIRRLKFRSSRGSMVSVLKRAFSMKTYRGHKSIVAPIKAMKETDWIVKKNGDSTVSGSEGFFEDDDDSLLYSQDLQWAQCKAGEDRVHVVVSDEHDWVFVGIYDGFNGPDAPDFLLSNLFSYVHKELKGLLWDDKFEPTTGATQNHNPETEDSTDFGRTHLGFGDNCSRNTRTRQRGGMKKCEWERERLELDQRVKEQLKRSGSVGSGLINHKVVLNALSLALKKTEDSFLDIADKMLVENPELSLMGSCVLVMLMKGEDVYVMNVGDSRAVLARKADPDYGLAKIRNDLERISEESSDGERSYPAPSLNAVQLTEDHSTSVDEEARRIKAEHPDDADALMNERVKGSLKVTRAFGAGFLKDPKWNNALLEMFRIDYLGTDPYITCNPSLYHHSVGPKDKFLILFSDGLNQFFTNEQAVSEVELFLELQPEGDPAQHLVEQVIYRAANKAGMDFHELLDIPQGDRRRYHDDVSVIVISLEGRIWRSGVSSRRKHSIEEDIETSAR